MNHAVPPPDSASAVQDYFNPEWMAAKRGLITYRRALIYRLILGIGGGVIIAIMTATASLGSLDTLLWLTLIVAGASAALTLWMLVGLFNYARVPAETGARGLATVAAVISALGLLVELYVTYLLARVVFGGFESFGDLAVLADNSFEVFARLGSLVGFVCLVVSLRKVAVHVGAPHVVDMIGSFVTLVIIIIGLFVLMLIVPLPLIALLGGLALLVLLIIALIRFLRILESLGQAIGGLDVTKVFE